MRGLVVLLAAAGCIEPHLLPCGEVACAPSEVCTPAGCATPGNVMACDGLGDGAPCKTTTNNTGACSGGSCQTGLCGNGRLDPGELCDLGGANGSCVGCSKDCQSDETCGNGIVDEECGETCDDRNANAAGGCELCKLTTWAATAVIGGSLDATTVGLGDPRGIAVDALGNVYVAEAAGNRIRRIDSTGVITTIAGTGAAGANGDGGRATSAELAAPEGVAVDGLGEIFIADTGNNRIRRVDTFGVITTIAGTGTAGFSGDTSAATSAQLDGPVGVAVDGLGAVYIVDTQNERIRRIDASGMITTIAGTGTPGFSGDGGPATTARLSLPAGVAVAGHDLYVADRVNNRIRRIDAAGVITTIAGSGSPLSLGDGGPAIVAGISNPHGVAVDSHGDIYIADENSRVRRVDTAGTITTIAGNGTSGVAGDGGPATSAELLNLIGVAVDSNGNVDLSVAYGANRVRRVDTAGIIKTIAGTGASGFTGDGGGATSAQFGEPTSMVVDTAGNIYVVDQTQGVVRRVDTKGVLSTIAGTAGGFSGFSGDGGPAISAELSVPNSIVIDGLGNLYISDASNCRVRRIDPAGIITTVAGSGCGLFAGDGGPATSAVFGSLGGIALDSHNNLYISDTDNERIRRVDPAGIVTTIAGSGTNGFFGDGGPATNAQFFLPEGVAVDGIGNVYIADLANRRIRRVDTAGIITTVVGNGTFGYSGDGGPATNAQIGNVYGLEIDGLGNLYIADRADQCVRRVDPAGIITTIAGSGAYAFSGDGGPATSSELMDPTDVTLDGHGNLYIADSLDGSIRLIDPGGTITTVAGPLDPEGVGPLAQARLADPRAFVITPSFTLFAGGSSGTVEAARPTWLEVVIGRYPQSSAIGVLARFRGTDFGDVGGVAYDAATSVVYVSESTHHRVHAVTIVDPADPKTWTIAPLAGAAGIAGFADGAANTAMFRQPTGLYLDAAAHQLYIADTGNHVIRAIDLANNTVRTVAGVAATRGIFGDGGPANGALLFAPEAITRCTNGDLFIADTGNNRIRRVAAGTNMITTVLGVGVAASSGEGTPASTFPVDAPLGLACDARGNLYVTSTTTVRLVLADASGVVDGTGEVQTIYAASPLATFPASVTRCLTGLEVADATTVKVVDSCTGLLVALHRQPK